MVACRASNPEDRPCAKEVFRRLSGVVNTTQMAQQQWVQQQQMASRSAFGTIQMQRLHSQETMPFYQRPPWAGPEHFGEEESPSFMAAIYEDDPLFSQKSMQSVHSGVLRKCTIDLSGRVAPGKRRKESMSRERRSNDEDLMRTLRSTSF